MDPPHAPPALEACPCSPRSNRDSVSPACRDRASASPPRSAWGSSWGWGGGVGDKAAWRQGMGKGFVLLLQMTVLPYISLSLITGLGRLRYQDVKMLALKVGALLLGSWALAFATILL